jgi:NAD(P)-dependent dehydrogenase (short-subunit alcohol dehydrogenase family)
VGALEGRIAIVTGAGRGIGREHALLLAREGARVVVNDLGSSADGVGADRAAAQATVEEILAFGGEAVANGDDVSSEDGSSSLVAQALAEFGNLHVLVNNAGILRDRMVVNMTADEWGDVMRTHLSGHFHPTRAAARYWREESKAGRQADRSIVHTTSTSGLFGNAGQTNYGAAKAGIASFTIICQMELERVRCQVQRHRAERPDAADACHRGRGRADRSARARVRPLRPREHRAVRRLSGLRRLPDQGPRLLCARK